MGNLYNKYLLSRILEGIPMPSAWQESFGIKLEGSAQVEIDSEDTSKRQQLSGYIFGRDNPLGRGFIKAKNLSEILGKKEKYLIQLLLMAIKDHEGADYTNYFNYSETSKVNGNYETTIPVIAGGIYTIIGTSELPATWSYYSELSGKVFASGEWGSLTVPRRINTNTTEYLEETSKKASEQEYFMIKVVASSKVVIVRGEILPQSMFNRFDRLREVKNGEKVLLPQLPSILNNIEYSNKLIPSLLGMNVSKDSSQELKQNIFSQLSNSGAQTLEEAVEWSTNSVYDRDGNIGGKLLW